MTNFVVPILPSYTDQDTIDSEDVSAYLHFLEGRDVETVMTTAGSSQFNLLSTSEVHLLNETVCKFKGKKIIGIPPVSLRQAKTFIHDASIYIDNDTNFMALYPDRYYDNKTVHSYFKELSDICLDKIYVHAMFMRNGRGGQYDYEADILTQLYEDGTVAGIKEENSNLQKSYDFVKALPQDMDVIAAGGSMRRHQFLRSAGANAFLSGIGNFIPEVEHIYCSGIDEELPGIDICLAFETKLFDTFSKYGWHQSLRAGLYEFLGFYPNDRAPWPKRTASMCNDIGSVLRTLKTEWDLYEW